MFVLVSPMRELCAVTRREALRRVGNGFGITAFASMLGQSLSAGTVLRPDGTMGAAQLDYPQRIRRVIFLFMHGGVSQVDSFDPKPRLAEMNGKPLPIAKPKFEFAPTGTCWLPLGNSAATDGVAQKSASCFPGSGR